MRAKRKKRKSGNSSKKVEEEVVQQFHRLNMNSKENINIPSIMTGFAKTALACVYRKQSSSPDFNKYIEAINALNSLQSNVSVIQEARRQMLNGTKKQITNVDTTLKYVKRIGLKLEDLERRLIHISGTKGKGSTAIMTEALLRNVPYKTGLFLSPHITSVRERIMINGLPLSQSDFVHYFWSVYDSLFQLKENESDMPSYFKFLTVMALKVFICEKVDVAILEVGIGGELDCTNIFKKTPIVGITSIGLDHTKLLGDNVEKIAWQKAGIMKPGCSALTVPYQSPSVLQVFRQRAQEKQCRFEVVPELSDYHWDANRLSHPQRMNASLAIQLAKAWTSWNNNGSHEDYNRLEVSQEQKRVLSNCSIPGRCQMISKKDSNITYFLDGAHTVDSMEVTKKWFHEKSPNNAIKILVFNVTGGRCTKNLLQLLIECNFSEAIFCTNSVSENEKDLPEDLIDRSTSMEQAFEKAKENLNVWSSIGGSRGHVKSSVAEAISLADQLMSDRGGSILFTGSLHLVGSALFLLS